MMGTDWVAIAVDGELAEGQMKPFELDGRRLLLVFASGQHYVVDEMCSHEDYSLALGCIKGTRIPASVVLDNLAEGMTADELVREYPSLTPEAIQAALAYAAALARERVIDMPA